MDADERLTALKKAYAEIILNTAKEAAARIMVSERKANRFEYELKHAKDEALQMLLRLKQMTDIKLNEAAVTSCAQQKKIEELEAQLQEAEEIVKDLREELRANEAELERFTRSKEVRHPVVEVDNASTRNTIRAPESISVHPLEVQSNSNKGQTSQSQKVYNSLFPFKKSLISNGDLPSIILRSKETELYRNGCTQRIRACELPPYKKLSFSMQMDDVMPELITKEDEVLKCNLEEKVVLDQVMDMDPAAEVLKCKHTNDTAPEKSSEVGVIDNDLVRKSSSQSSIREELMPMRQEKEELSQSAKPQVDPLLAPETSKRVIRYTFQRKRKFGGSLDKSATRKRNEENETVHLEIVKAKSTGESTPEKIRLEQVAHQLISLSDKKWW